MILKFEDLLPLNEDIAVGQSQYILPDPFVDDLTNDNLSMNVPILHSGVDLTNQGFLADIQNQDQIQSIHDDTIGFASANPEFVANQDHAQMIPNYNSTTAFNSLSQRTTVIGSGSGSRHALSKETISMHFDKPILQAARKLNVGSTQLKQRCRKLGIKSWPRRKIKSLQTLINHTQELNNNPSKADVILGLENEKREIVEGSSSKITDTIKRLRQAAFKAVYKKRKVQKREEASLGTDTQQQSLPFVSAMSGFNHDFLKTISEENPEDLVGDIARLQLSD
ncbi:hypothetical protein L2E82_45711 [Cichorium intybus]|uniref:Uncharacterized protein n=1 Tax=Cichorium intybus TaxID=13427 RepID=A0ACB8ZTU4_CICIN|nr:hypothetical protein L2E82_45711 [Cichorium intybus]